MAVREEYLRVYSYSMVNMYRIGGDTKIIQYALDYDRLTAVLTSEAIEISPELSQRWKEFINLFTVPPAPDELRSLLLGRKKQLVAPMHDLGYCNPAILHPVD